MRYRLGKRRNRHYWRKLFVGLVILVLVGSIYYLLHLHPHSAIQNGQAVSRDIKPTNTAKIHIDKPLFTMQLPAGWKETGPTVRVNIPNYTFVATPQAGQSLQIYLDNIPTGVAVNRAISVSASGAGLSHDNVSDNCTQYTQAVIGQTSTTGSAMAKWENVVFLCDTGNYERDVIGTESPDGVNQVNLTGPTAGPHKVFMLYTDNNINPDYSTFYGILDSFKLK